MKWAFIFCLLLLCKTAEAQQPHLTYLGYRWMTNDNVNVNLGYEEVGNRDGPQVATTMLNAINTWRHPMGGATFSVTYTGQHYPIQRNMSNDVCWEYVSGDTLAKSVEFTTSDYWSRRIREVDQWYSPGPGSNSYCWWDCDQAHPPHCTPSHDYDFQSIALHEWGHGFAGLFHTVDPNCDYSVSIMQSMSKSYCIKHRNLGTLDQQFTQWALQGAYSFKEPQDDYIYGAWEMGSLTWHGDQVDAEGSDLGGYSDVDFYLIQVVNPEAYTYIEFVVNPANWNTDVSFAVYKDMGILQEVNAEGAGESEYWDEPAQQGNYHLAVGTPDYMPGGAYNVVVMLYWQVCDVPTTPRQPQSPRPDLRFLSMSGGILTDNLPAEGHLSLYDASGRSITSWNVPRTRTITPTNGLRLRSGVYFAKLSSSGVECTTKLVVVQ